MPSCSCPDLTKHRTYDPLSWRDGTVRYLDQVLLPHTVSYSETSRYEDIVGAIRCLSIRGAPLIGIAGAYAVVLVARQHPDDRSAFVHAVEQIANARPTAANLRYAVDRLLRRLGDEEPGSDRGVSILLTEAQRIHDETRAADEAIAHGGASLLREPSGILTICNTGPLATGGHGTAFGVIEEAWRRGMVRELYACETRPLLQGARLTMWELRQAGIPGILVHDSAAGTLFLERRIDAVIVGADRIAANGDTANKVGTYVLACLADRHRVPFYVAAPSSTIDGKTPDGTGIPIEERSPAEVVTFAGQQTAPEGTSVRSPAFDVTPNALITGIITERGVFRPPYDFRSAGVAPPGTS